MKKRKRNSFIICLFLALAVSVPGCGKDAADGLSIYYLDSQGTGLVTVNYQLKGNTTDEQVGELLEQLSEQKEDVDYFIPIVENLTVNGYEFNEETGIITVDFDQEYSLLTVTNEVMLRAAVVKTLSQLEHVKGICFTVGGNPLLTPAGLEMGVMNDDSFLYDYGREQSQAEKGVLLLYYATTDGNNLSAVNRTVHYNSSIPMEQVVMNYLAESPETQGLMSAIPEGTKVLSVLINENTCYVTLDSGFLNLPEGESRDVAVYSIVNSLCELDGVIKVQILVDGESDTPAMDVNPVSGTYEANPTIVL